MLGLPGTRAPECRLVFWQALQAGTSSLSQGLTGSLFLQLDSVGNSVIHWLEPGGTKRLYRHTYSYLKSTCLKFSKGPFLLPLRGDSSSRPQGRLPLPSRSHLTRATNGLGLTLWGASWFLPARD